MTLEELYKRIDLQPEMREKLCIIGEEVNLEKVNEILQQMQELKSQIATLEQTEPPKDFTTETIQAWLEAIKAAPDVDAVHLLIERIDTRVDKEKEKTDFNMESTLKSVLRNHGCGGSQHTFPEILFRYFVSL